MKRVLVTGGAGGIGAAICRAFAQDGCQIAVHYHHSETRAQALCAELEERYRVTARAYGADIADSKAVGAMFDQIERDGGGLDVLVCNAGIAQQKLFTDITDEDWRRMTAVDLDGVFYCCREALRRFMNPAHSGAICTVSSMWGRVGASCEVHYSAAKAGVIGLTKALAKEVGLSGVRVNCVAPGVIMTDMMKGFDAQTVAALKEEAALNALGTPEDVAEAVRFLCSKKARFITGQVLGVDGGFL